MPSAVARPALDADSTMLFCTSVVAATFSANAVFEAEPVTPVIVPILAFNSASVETSPAPVPNEMTWLAPPLTATDSGGRAADVVEQAGGGVGGVGEAGAGARGADREVDVGVDRIELEIVAAGAGGQRDPAGVARCRELGGQVGLQAGEDFGVAVRGDRGVVDGAGAAAVDRDVEAVDHAAGGAVGQRAAVVGRQRLVGRIAGDRDRVVAGRGGLRRLQGLLGDRLRGFDQLGQRGDAGVGGLQRLLRLSDRVEQRVEVAGAVAERLRGEEVARIVERRVDLLAGGKAVLRVAISCDVLCSDSRFCRTPAERTISPMREHLFGKFAKTVQRRLAPDNDAVTLMRRKKSINGG